MEKTMVGTGIGTGRPASRFLVGIGASAGGPKALQNILQNLSTDVCGILIVQHLSKGFSKSFAQYLDGLLRLKVKEAVSGEPVLDGTVYLPSDGCQMSIWKSGDRYLLKNEPGERIGGFAPAIDPLFKSLAKTAGKNAMGIILTGMGEDGAAGLLEMKQAGAYTIVQDKETSEIHNMPSAAFLRGGAARRVPLENIAGEISGFCTRMRNNRGI